MLFENTRVQNLIQALARKLVANLCLQEDLVQEGLLHLWQTESAHAGQTESWYIESCSFPMRDRLESGRSVDSHQRQHLQALPPAQDSGSDSPDQLAWEASLGADDTFHSCINAREAASLLLKTLSRLDRLILLLLHRGFGVNRIARRLHCSHDFIATRRANIRRLAIRLGISPR